MAERVNTRDVVPPTSFGKNRFHPATVIGVSLFVAAVGLQFHESLSWGHDNWGMTDWLINYQGGFVRRGLPGELFYRLSHLTGIPANEFALTLSWAPFAILAAFFAYSAARVPIVLIVSPVLLGSAAYQSFIVRKDSADRPGAHRVSGAVHPPLAAAARGCVSAELFFFFAFPVLVIRNAARPTERGEGVRPLLASAAELSLILIAFALST